jgi:hypothetical protein
MQNTIERVNKDGSVTRTTTYTVTITAENYKKQQEMLQKQIDDLSSQIATAKPIFDKVIFQENLMKTGKINTQEITDGLIDNDGGAIKEPSIRPDVVIEPDPAKLANLEPKDSGEAK